MIQVRRSIFETNSSSVHSLTFISDEEYELFMDGGALFDTWGDKIIPREDAEREGYDPNDCDEWSPRRYWSCENLYELGYEYGGEAFCRKEDLPDGGHVNYICYFGHD